MNLLPTTNFTSSWRGESRQSTAGKAAGAGGARQKPPNVQPPVWNHLNLQIPSRHSTQLSFYSMLSEHFNRHMIYGAPSMVLVSEIPDCIPFPSVISLKPAASYRNCEVRWRASYKPPLHSVEEKTIVRHGWAPRYTRQQKTSTWVK